MHKGCKTGVTAYGPAIRRDGGRGEGDSADTNFKIILKLVEAKPESPSAVPPNWQGHSL